MILDTEEFSKFANSLADDASKTSMHYFRNKIEIEIKDDESPVTLADKETEQVLRERIRKEYPEHGILGEEYENENINSEFLWVLDPIDGTRSYIAGHRDFGNLISLLYKNEPVIGIINCPAHKERWIGIKDKKTTCNGIEVPLQITKRAGEYVAAIRFKAWSPYSSLHPMIQAHGPLVFDLVDKRYGRSIGACKYHVSHPGGRNYETYPVNENEADGRMLSCFELGGHSPANIEVIKHEPNFYFPHTLDLRFYPDFKPALV